ncbi:non-specific lipid-transfer protein 1-like [Benincasa hispida]|uniref:non-specific lipid-transfer protein 1-like n=1 Tax=Benincasa hispida TaxID=102211 RepID=UPI00190244F1|nr:non-specific lipid-transfer protein 1-like [Benincasa hispida]
MASNLIGNVKLGLIITFLCTVIGGRVMTEAVVTCNQVISNLNPCVQFVTGGGAPSGNCCSGVRQLFALAQTTPDRQAVCRCLKSVVNGVRYSGKNVANAAALPSKCGVQLPYAIDPNVDCNTIKM